jgi:arylsulfatase A-like enzyme
MRLLRDKEYRVFILTNFTVTHNLYTLDPLFSPEDRKPNTMPSEFRTVGVTVEEFNKYRRMYLGPKTGFPISRDFQKTVDKWGLSQEELIKFTRVVEYLYKCGVRMLDKLFGKVINRLAERGLLAESLVIFTADHGETLYRDNAFFKFTHGFELGPEVLAVPLIVRAPSLGIKSRKCSFVSRSIDVFPTISGLCGLRIPEKERPDGVDLSSVMDGQIPAPSLPAFSHTVLVNERITRLPEYKGSVYYKLYPRRDPNLMWVSVRMGNMVFKWEKYNPDCEDFAPFVFDLSKDPTERQNLYDNKDKHHQEVLDELKRYKGRLVSACHLRYSTGGPGIPEGERIRRLKSLGYI